MNYKEYEITSVANSAIEVELAYYIATSRAEGAEIVKIIVPKEPERIIATVRRSLRALKRDGRVQLFEDVEKLTSDTTEAQYLRNKYRDFTGACIGEASGVIIKL